MSAEVTQVKTTYKLDPPYVARSRYTDKVFHIDKVCVVEYCNGRPGHVEFHGNPLSKNGKDVGTQDWRSITDDSAAAIMAIVGAS